METFELPCVRSMKVIGISTKTRPALWKWYNISSTIAGPVEQRLSQGIASRAVREKQRYPEVQSLGPKPRANLAARFATALLI